MPDQNKEERCGILRGIVHWAWVFFVLLLLAAGIVFEGPWKVNILLLIFLLASTTLPKAFRKWFWRGVGVVVLILVVWVFLPDDNEGWRPYTFDEELARLEEKRAVPEEENAAVLYEKLLQSSEPNDFNHNAFSDTKVHKATLSRPWTNEEFPEVGQWLQDQQTIVDGLLEASNLEKCSFAVSPHAFVLGATMDRVTHIKLMCVLLSRSANYDAGLGDYDNAVKKLVGALRSARHLKQQTSAIEFIVAEGIEKLAIERIVEMAVGEPLTEDHLKVLEEALRAQRYDSTQDWLRVADYEKLSTKNLFCSLMYEVNEEGEVRYSRNQAAGLAFFTDAERVFETSYWSAKWNKAKTLLACLGMPANPEQVGRMFDKHWARSYAAAVPGFEWEKETEQFSWKRFKLSTDFLVELLCWIAEGGHHGFREAYARAWSLNRGCQIVIALRGYKDAAGDWPERLAEIADLMDKEDLVDPVSCETFVYRRTQGGFTLYRNGANKTDDNGELDDIVIWPQEGDDDKKERNQDEQ